MVDDDTDNPEPDYRYEMIVKVVLIYDGTESCPVGFLPLNLVEKPEEASLNH